MKSKPNKTKKKPTHGCEKVFSKISISPVTRVCQVLASRTREALLFIGAPPAPCHPLPAGLKPEPLSLSKEAR